eukprot:COSAG02_NODE_9922_length_2074_cov_1.895190_1_plen_108_part_00
MDDDVTSILQSYYSATHFKQEFVNTYGPVPKGMQWSSTLSSVMNKGAQPGGGGLLPATIIYQGINKLYHDPSGRGRANALALVTRLHASPRPLVQLRLTTICLCFVP